MLADIRGTRNCMEYHHFEHRITVERHPREWHETYLDSSSAHVESLFLDRLDTIESGLMYCMYTEKDVRLMIAY